jgi:hypothetical protein
MTLPPVIAFSEGIKVTRLDKHTYAADLAADFCIGTGKLTPSPSQDSSRHANTNLKSPMAAMWPASCCKQLGNT